MGEAARTLMRKYGEPVTTGPVDALLNLLYETAGNVAWLRERVRESAGLVVAGKMQREEETAYVRLYNDERDRLQRISTDALKIGIAERQVRVYEMQAKVLVSIVKAIIEACELTQEQRHIAVKVAAKALRDYVTATPSPLATGSRETAA
jgi:hypothetical protein